MVNSALHPQQFAHNANLRSRYAQAPVRQAPPPAPHPPQSASREEPAKAFPSGMLIKLTGILCVLALLLYGLAQLFGEQISRGGHEASDRMLEIVVANSVLNIPANKVRFASQRSNSSQKRLELYMHWPTLSGYNDHLKDHFSLVGSQESLIFMTLEPRNMSLEMSGRIKPIYSKFIDGEPELTRFGLTRHALSPEGGFIDEDLYYEATKTHPFAVRCVREASTVGSPMCIRDLHIGKDLMLTYRFHIQHIGHWKKIDHIIQDMIGGMIIN